MAGDDGRLYRSCDTIVGTTDGEFVDLDPDLGGPNDWALRPPDPRRVPLFAEVIDAERGICFGADILDQRGNVLPWRDVDPDELDSHGEPERRRRRFRVGRGRSGFFGIRAG
jgi:hypothetical protein